MKEDIKEIFSFLIVNLCQIIIFSALFKVQGEHKHLKAQLKEIYCVGQCKFNIVEEFVEHYKKAQILQVNKEKSCILSSIYHHTANQM